MPIRDLAVDEGIDVGRESVCQLEDLSDGGWFTQHAGRWAARLWHEALPLHTPEPLSVSFSGSPSSDGALTVGETAGFVRRLKRAGTFGS